jgi:flagella basal body P-ring formation protein FlgA
MRYSILAVCLLSGWLASSAFGLEILLKESSVVQGERITLGEISHISPATENAQALGLVELLLAPQPGQETTIRASEIKQIITRRGIITEDIDWRGPEDIRIKRASIHIDGEAIEKILAEYLAGKKEIVPQAEIRFKEIRLVRPFDLPVGDLSTEVIPSDPSILASRRFTILFRVNSKVEQNIAVQTQLEAMASVAVAAKDLRRGSIITADDINLLQLDIINLANPSFAPEELIGKELKRSLRQGYPYDQSAMEMPPIIHRGELVTIFVRKGSMLITARGTATHDAQRGATVKVVNNNSQKEILCRADAPGLVKVEL